jgi:hypothetical protein
MQVVLYTTDFEPITILDLPQWLLDQMEKQGGARVAVYMPPEEMHLEDIDEINLETFKPEIVTIFCEKLRWRDDSLKTILVTPHEELALVLRPEWLPGQRQAVNHYKKRIHFLTEQLIKLGRQS